MTGVASRMFDKKDRGMFMCIRCVTSTCLCTQDKHSSVASKMCASSKNVNIPTPPHPTPCHGFTKNHKTRGVANGAVGKNKHSTVALGGAFGLSLSSFFSLSPLPFPLPFPFSELAPLAPSAFALAFGFTLGTALPGKPLVSSSLFVPLPPPDLSPLESVPAAKADFGGGCGFPLGCNAALILSSFWSSRISHKAVLSLSNNQSKDLRWESGDASFTLSIWRWIMRHFFTLPNNHVNFVLSEGWCSNGMAFNTNSIFSMNAFKPLYVKLSHSSSRRDCSVRFAPRCISNLNCCANNHIMNRPFGLLPAIWHFSM